MVGTAPQPKSQTLLFGKVGAHFPGDDPTEGPCVLLFLCICFGFFLLFCCVFFRFLLFFCFFCFLPQLFAISFKKYPVLEVPNSDRGPSLLAGHLSRREPRHCAFFGFTGSPRTSLFKFNVSFVFCAGFTTLSRLIWCFNVCCIWHFPFSLVAFHLSIFSTYHVASFQLALVPSMCSSFVKCAPFRVAFALSMFHPFAIFASFQLAFCFPIFSAIVMCASFRFAFSNSTFCIVSPFFSRCKHPRTSAIRQHKRTDTV